MFDEDDLIEMMERRAGMTEREAAELEASLAQAPGSLDTRLRLIGYCSEPPKRFDLLAAHISALIESDPTLPVLSFPLLTRAEHSGAYAVVEAAWLEAAEGTTNPDVLFNAHRAIMRSTFEHGERLLSRGLASAPQDPRWHRAALEMYYFHAVERHDRQMAVRAAEAGQRLLELSTSDVQRAGVLPLAIRAALEAYDAELSGRLADEALSVSVFNVPNRYYGHLAHGLLAYDAGDIAKAESHLMISATHVEGWYFEHFDPPLRLAQALLQARRCEAVREFLLEVQKRWTTGEHKVRTWLRAVEEEGGRARLDREWPPQPTR